MSGFDDPNHYYMFGRLLGSVVPILLVSWVLRVLFRSDSGRGIVLSVLAALLLAVVLGAFGNANGVYTQHILVLSAKRSFLTYLDGAVLALVLIFGWHQIKSYRRRN